MKTTTLHRKKRIVWAALVFVLLNCFPFYAQNAAGIAIDDTLVLTEPNKKADSLTAQVWPVISMYDFNFKLETTNTIHEIEMTVLDEYGEKVMGETYTPGQVHDTIYRFGGNLDSGQYVIKFVQNDKVHYQTLVRR
ncbi:hypothetical protein [Cognatitamlana onchidii]|uniref:hypothetical protein n=1 Tax=Cognatitamlana onchidii TaxID=2562860 RepID=UPI0010A6A590|nr:hypothetical protein [Algibacter onchidii]